MSFLLALAAAHAAASVQRHDLRALLRNRAFENLFREPRGALFFGKQPLNQRSDDMVPLNAVKLAERTKPALPPFRDLRVELLVRFVFHGACARESEYSAPTFWARHLGVYPARLL